MAQPRVSRFSRSDNESTFVLVHIASNGSKSLDLKLIATEGEAPYAATLKNDKVASLMVKNCPVSADEWHAILVALFSQEPAADIQATATVQGESSIALTIRKQVQGITQRLGSITLKHDEDEAIELFDWCGLAAAAASKSKQEHIDAVAKSEEATTIIEKLKAQLDELVKAKQDDESALLHKFRDLLNEKKVKIREQQKLLATASFHGQEGGEQQASVPLSQSSAPEPKRRPAPSRSGKRKTHPPAVEESTDGEDPDQMDIDQIKSEPQETDSGRETEDTASVASDDDSDGAGAAKPSAVVPNIAPAAKKKAEQPPPKRDLPFANRRATKPPAKSIPAAAQGSETESDDEL
jgi:hypothetical protein